MLLWSSFARFMLVELPLLLAFALALGATDGDARRLVDVDFLTLLLVEALSSSLIACC